VATRQGIFRRGPEGFDRVVLPAGWADRPVRHMARDRNRSLWLASSGGQVARWDDQGLQPFPLPAAHAGRSIRDLQIDAGGQPWVLLENALLRLEEGRWVDEPLPDLPRSPKLLSLHCDPKPGGYQVALGGDGLLVKEAGGRARVLTSQSGLPRDRIAVALRDRRGVLWVGSDGDGLAAQALPGLLSVENAPGQGGLNLAAVSSILELGSDRFLLASSTGLYRVDEPHGITAHWSERQGLPANELWGLLADGEGGAWVGTDRGLARWQNGRVAPAGPSEMARAAVLTLVRHRGRILAGTDRGLFELDPKGRLLAHHQLPDEVGDPTIADILFHDGHLLLATGLGLWELADGRLQRFQTEAPFARITVTAMATDTRQRLWVGTMKGLHLLSQGRWSSFGTADGLPDEGITFIVDVGQGRMAFGHNKGVTLLEGRRMHHLGYGQGLVSEETNHNGYLLDSKGRLWIGMIGGANILKDVRGFRNPRLPDPILLDLRYPEGSQPLAGAAVVPPRPDFLDFTFDTGAPLVSSPVQYEAFLQGADTGWRPVNQGLSVQYRNLGAGNYRFRLRAAIDGVSWVEGRPTDIEILPAWHERWSVRGLLAVGFLGLLSWVLWIRVHTLALRSRRLEETIDERTLLLAHQNRALEQAHGQIKRSLEGRLKLLDTVTHDLRSPLTTILLTLDRLRELVSEDTNLLDVMEREAHRIEVLVHNLLDQSRSEALIQSLKLVPTPPSEVTEGFEDVLRLKAEARGISFHLDVSPETDRVHIQADTATLHQVMLNLFENALKFTPSGGSVGVHSTVDRASGTWRLEVWDTGRGLAADKIEEILQPFRQAHGGDAAQGWGLGLSICLSILDAHGGELKIDSEPGKGARFSMVLPLVPFEP